MGEHADNLTDEQEDLYFDHMAGHPAFPCDSCPYCDEEGDSMDTQALQHQDEIEQQQMILEALKRLWCYMSEDNDSDALLIASALGLSKEFRQILAPRLLAPEKKP